MASKTLVTLEAFAVFGILTLYITEFLGFETVSTFFTEDQKTELGTLSFQVGPDLLTINQGSLLILVALTFFVLGAFVLARRRRTR